MLASSVFCMQFLQWIARGPHLFLQTWPSLLWETLFRVNQTAMWWLWWGKFLLKSYTWVFLEYLFAKFHITSYEHLKSLPERGWVPYVTPSANQPELQVCELALRKKPNDRKTLVIFIHGPLIDLKSCIIISMIIIISIVVIIATGLPGRKHSKT